jgi:hypothetical protein
MIEFDSRFIKKHARLADKYKSPLLFFHSFHEDGSMQYEGYIYSMTKVGSGMAKLFSGLTGEVCDETGFTAAFLESCHFYFTDSEMRAAANVIWANYKG